MARGFVYLVAIMDWHARRVLSWRLSTTQDRHFRLENTDWPLDEEEPAPIRGIRNWCPDELDGLAARGWRHRAARGTRPASQ